jgi:thioredoxin 1
MKTFSRYLILVVGMSLFSGCSWFKTREEDRAGVAVTKGVDVSKEVANLIRINSKDQFQDIIMSSKYVVVDFFATWCPPCQTMLGINKEVAAELKDIKIVEVDIDRFKDITVPHSVMGVPTFVFYKDGNKLADRHVGAMTKPEYIEKAKGIFGL